MEIESGLGVSAVFWISSFRSGEGGVTRRILEDLAPFCDSIEIPFQACRVESIAAFERSLAQILEYANGGGHPLIHIDMHGSKKDGLEIGPTGDFVSWASVVRRFQAINIATHNNLGVVSGACFGLHAINQLTLSDASPFFMLIAPEKEVTFGFLEDHVFPFYREVLSTGDIRDAYSTHLSNVMAAFHCEKFLAQVLLRYLHTACRGKSRQERQEQLLTEVLSVGQQRSKNDLKAIRKQIKDGLRPTQEMLNEYAQSFLIGRPCSFTMDALLNLVT